MDFLLSFLQNKSSYCYLLHRIFQHSEIYKTNDEEIAPPYQPSSWDNETPSGQKFLKIWLSALLFMLVKMASSDFS